MSRANRKQLLRLIHDYFSEELDASLTRNLFIEFAKNPDESADLVQVESLKNGRGRFRVRLDDSQYRLVFAGRIVEEILYVDFAWIFSYKKDKSYKIFLKNNDYDLSESTHICLVCANTGKILKKACPLCSQQWKTRRFDFNKREPQPSIFIGDPTLMRDVDKGWDIDLGIW
jgi:hypothetical protein